MSELLYSINYDPIAHFIFAQKRSVEICWSMLFYIAKKLSKFYDAVFSNRELFFQIPF